MELKHLSNSVKKIALLDNETRIRYIQKDKWIPYPKSEEILARLDELIHYPPTHRMINYLIVGETNNGKTALINKLQDKYKAYIINEEDGVRIPVLSIQAPPVPDEKRFYNNILERLAIPYSENGNISKKEKHIIRVLEKINLRMLIIDEIHHILAGTLSKQRAFLNVLKYISNELQISIVAVGTKDAFNAINLDPQLSNRFETGILHKWKFNKDFLRLLASFETIIPLQSPSLLYEKGLAMKIFTMTEGTIGEVSNLIKHAAVYAIKNNEEKITLDILNKLKWRSPSERRKARIY